MIYSCALVERCRRSGERAFRKLDHHITRPAQQVRPRAQYRVRPGWLLGASSSKARSSSRRADPQPLPGRVWIRRNPAARNRGSGGELASIPPHRPDSPMTRSSRSVLRALRPSRHGAARRLEAYREFFAWCDGALVPACFCRSRRSLTTLRPSDTVRRHRPSSRKDIPGKRSAAIMEPAAAAE